MYSSSRELSHKHTGLLGMVLYIILPINFLSFVARSSGGLYGAWQQEVITNLFELPVGSRRHQNRYTEGGRANYNRYSHGV